MQTGLLARLGQWCFHRRWLVLAAWLVVAGAGVAASGLVFERLADKHGSQRFEAFQGLRVLLDSAAHGGDIIGVVEDVDPGAPGVGTAVRRAAAELAARDDVWRVASPYGQTGTGTDTAYLSSTGRGLLVVVTVKKLTGSAHAETIDAIDARLHRLATDLHDSGELNAVVRVGGDPVLRYQTGRAFDADIRRGEAVAAPLALIVLILVFGSLIAGVMPLVTAAVTAGSAMLVVLGFVSATEVDSYVFSVNVIALALSIDYALLLVGRYREELFAGHAADVAAARAWATAGRTVVFSSLILAAATSGLLVFDDTTMRALGAGAVSITAVAALVSLTLTAAVLGLAGGRIRPAPPATHASQPWLQFIPVSAFSRIAATVQRRPWTVALTAGGLLLAAGVPALSTTLRLDDVGTMPRSIEAVRVADDLADRYGRPRMGAVTVVARTDAGTLARWAARYADDPHVAQVRPAATVAPGLSVVDFAVAGGDAQSAQAKELVRLLRAQRPDGVRTWVIGEAAALIDFKSMISERLPAAIGLMLLAVLALLFVMTGSLVVPVKAVLANVVSLGATLGILNLVFERGFLSPVLGTTTVAGIDPLVILPVLVFAFAFSVDYEVFLISRVVERVRNDREPASGDPAADARRLSRLTDLAVREGLEHTGRIITCAALLMVVVFAGFAAGRLSITEQFGIGLATALVIDATVIRCLLVPATMTLLGRWNWWAPAPLRRLHDRYAPAGH